MHLSERPLLRKLDKAFRQGAYLDLAEGKPISDQQFAKWPWGDERIVTTDELERLILRVRPSESLWGTRGRGLRVRGLRVIGKELTLSYANLDYFLFFQRCRFDCDFTFIQGRANLLIFRGSQLKQFTADRLDCPLVAFDEEDPDRGQFRIVGGERQSTVVNQSVRMKNASLGHLSLCRTVVGGLNVQDISIDLEGCSIRDYLDLTGTSAAGFVDLSRVKCGELRLGELKKSNLTALGLRDLSYLELTGSPRRSPGKGLEWLGWQDRSRRDNFSFEPYETLATYYDKVGQNSFARSIRIDSARQRGSRRKSSSSLGDGPSGGPQSAWGWILTLLRKTYWLVAGYGYRPIQSIGAFGVTVALTWILCFIGSGQFGRHVVIAHAVPTTSGSGSPVVRTSTTSIDGTDGEHPHVGESLQIAFNNDVPILDVGTSDVWRLHRTASEPLRWLLVALKLVGYVLLTVAVAGLTGFLKKI